MNATTTPSPFSVIVKREIPRKRVQDLLVGLFENNYSPWLLAIQGRNFAPGLTLRDFKKGGKMTDPEDYYTSSQIIPVTEGCGLVLRVDNPNGESSILFTLDIAAIQKGLQIMADQYPRHFQDILDENDDANTSDIFGQCICYGEEIFS